MLIYNVRPQAMARLNLGYEEVAKVNPRILYVGVYGYGQGGPYAAKSAYDDLIQGAVAIPSLANTAGADVPRYAPSAIADRIVALAAANAVTAGLFHRERTGEGQAIDVPMFETMAQFVLGDHMGGLTFDPPIGPSGYARILDHNRRPYRTKDGYVCVLVYNDKQWRRFFEMIGKPGLMDNDPRFATIGERTKHINELYQMVAEVMPTRTSAEWIALLEAADMPVMQLHTIDSLLADRHLDAVGFFDVVEHPTEGAIRSMAIPSQWSKRRHRSHARRLAWASTAPRCWPKPATAPQTSANWPRRAPPCSPRLRSNAISGASLDYKPRNPAARRHSARGRSIARPDSRVP